MACRLTFSARKRIKHKRDFTRVFEARCSVSDALLVVYVIGNCLGFSRVGVSASRRLGGAVIRNRYKRLVREAFRVSQGELPNGLDVLCVIKHVNPPQRFASLRMQDYRASLLHLVPKAVRRLSRPRSEGGRRG